MIGELLRAKVDEADARLLEFLGWPLRSFEFVADMAGPVKVMKAQGQLGEKRLRTKVIDFKVFPARCPLLIKETIGAAPTKIISNC